jgi:hypothetical protein
MEIFRLMFLTTAFVALTLVHATLFIWDEGVKIWSGSTGDGWHIECVYYTPFRLFSQEVFFGQDCPPRIIARAPPRT